MKSFSIYSIKSKSVFLGLPEKIPGYRNGRKQVKSRHQEGVAATCPAGLILQGCCFIPFIPDKTDSADKGQGNGRKVKDTVVQSVGAGLPETSRCLCTDRTSLRHNILACGNQYSD